MADYQLVKILGVDADSPLSKGGTLQPTTPLKTTDITQEKFAKARAYQEAGYEAQLKAINAVGKAKREEALSRSQNGTGAAIADIVGNMQAALKVYQASVAQKNQQVEEQNEKTQKRMDKELKAQNEEGQTLAQGIIRDQLLNLFKTTGDKGGQEGIEATRQKVLSTINNQFSSLPAEMRKELINTAYSGLEEAQKKQTTRKIEDMAELKAANRDMQKANLEYLTSALSVRLGTARTQDEQQQTWTQFWEVVKEQTQGLDTVDKLKVTAQVLQGALSQYQGGEQARQKLIEESNAIAQLYSEAQPIIDQYNNGEIGEYEKEAKIRVLAQRYGVAGLADNLPDIYSITQKAVEYQRNQNSLKDMAEDNASAMTFGDSNEAWKYHIGSLVYELGQNSPDARILLQAASEGKNTKLTPLERTAVSTYKEFQEDRKRWHSLTKDYGEKSVALAKLLDSLNVRNFGQSQDEASFLRAIQSLRSDMLSNPAEVEKAIKGLTGLREESRRKLAQSAPEVAKALDSLRDTVLPEMRELREKWGAMGLNITNPRDKTGLQGLEAKTSAIREEARKRGNVPITPKLPNF